MSENFPNLSFQGMPSGRVFLVKTKECGYLTINSLKDNVQSWCTNFTQSDKLPKNAAVKKPKVRWSEKQEMCPKALKQTPEY